MSLTLTVLAQIAAIFVLFYLPGALIIARIGPGLNWLEKLVLSHVLGTVMTAGVYWACLRCGAAPLFWAWPALLLLLFLLQRAKRSAPPTKPEYPRRQTGWLLAGIFAGGMTIFSLFPPYFTNLRFRSDGGMNAYPLRDVYLHVAIANELTHEIPPKSPLFAGAPLSYHVGSDLPTAILSHTTGLEVRDEALRVIPPLLFGLSMLAVFCYARRWLGSDGWAALTTSLIFFGEDFSFLPNLLLGSSSPWTVGFSRLPSVYSLYVFNPMLAGVGLLFASLLSLELYFKEGKARWLTIAAVFAAGLVKVKVFGAAQLGFSLGLVGAVDWIARRDYGLLKAAGAVALATGPLLLFTMLDNRSGGELQVQLGGWRAWEPLGRELTRLGLPDWGQIYLVAIVPLAVAVALGLRLVGAGAIWRTLRHPMDKPKGRVLLAVFVTSGIVLTCLFRLVPTGNPNGYDNGGWFFVFSKYAAWLFAVEWLQAASRRFASPRAPVMIAAATLSLSLPSTLLFFRDLTRYFRADAERGFTPAETQIVRQLGQHARPGDAVICPEKLAHPVLALTACHLPIGDFVEYMVPREAIVKRRQALQTFWDDWSHGRLNLAAAASMQARFVIAAKPLPPLGADLKPIAENDSYALFELPRPETASLPAR